MKHSMVYGLEGEESEFNKGDTDDRKKRGELANYIFYVASYFTKLGDHKEAMKLYHKELDLVEGFPNDSQDYLIRKATCYVTIGSGHFYLGENKEALENFVISLETNEELFGTEHQRTATAMFNTGATMLELGDLDGALELFNKCVAIYEKLYGENHAYTATS